MKVLPPLQRSKSLSPNRLNADEVETVKSVSCSRCRNHGFHTKLKGHKNVCPFRACVCSHCSLITKRKIIDKNIHDKKCLDLNNSFTAAIRESFDNMKVSSETCSQDCHQEALSFQQASSSPTSSFFNSYMNPTVPSGSAIMRMSSSFSSGQNSRDGSVVVQTRICQTTWTYAYDKPVSSCQTPPPPTRYAVSPEDVNSGQRNRSVVLSNLQKIFPRVEKSVISHYYHMSHGDVWKTFSYLNEAREKKKQEKQWTKGASKSGRYLIVCPSRSSDLSKFVPKSDSISVQYIYSLVRNENATPICILIRWMLEVFGVVVVAM